MSRRRLAIWGWYLTASLCSDTLNIAGRIRDGKSHGPSGPSLAKLGHVGQLGVVWPSASRLLRSSRLFMIVLLQSVSRRRLAIWGWYLTASLCSDTLNIAGRLMNIYSNIATAARVPVVKHLSLNRHSAAERLASGGYTLRSRLEGALSNLGRRVHSPTWVGECTLSPRWEGIPSYLIGRYTFLLK